MSFTMMPRVDLLRYRSSHVRKGTRVTAGTFCAPVRYQRFCPGRPQVLTRYLMPDPGDGPRAADWR